MSVAVCSTCRPPPPALCVLPHPAVYRKGLLIYSVLNDMAVFHGKQIKECQTPQGCLLWYTMMALGVFWWPVLQARNLLHDFAPLDKSGSADHALKTRNAE